MRTTDITRENVEAMLNDLCNDHPKFFYETSDVAENTIELGFKGSSNFAIAWATPTAHGTWLLQFAADPTDEAADGSCECRRMCQMDVILLGVIATYELLDANNEL